MKKEKQFETDVFFSRAYIHIPDITQLNKLGIGHDGAVFGYGDLALKTLKYDIDQRKEKNLMTFEKAKYIITELSLRRVSQPIDILLTQDEKIVRKDNYYGNNSYELVSRRQEKSPYTKHYCSFTDDNPTMKKKILLISDTHIGNKSIQNIDLINAIYEYASKQGCEYVFHEGDLFEGYGNAQEQINTFIKVLIK